MDAATFTKAEKACAITIKNADTYLAVEDKTKVPWFVVAALHMRESHFDFTKHLHNGDPLSARTTHTPIGRPPLGEPPFRWSDSAIDALQYEGFSNYDTWDVPTSFYHLEAWNGHGYRKEGVLTNPENASPYIYAGTQFYKSGKYVSDHKFDPKEVDDQLGCMAFLKHLSTYVRLF